MITPIIGHANENQFTDSAYDSNSIDIAQELIFKKHKINDVTKNLLRGKIKQYLPFSLNMFSRCNIKQESYLLIKYRQNEKKMTLNYNVRF